MAGFSECLKQISADPQLDRLKFLLICILETGQTIPSEVFASNEMQRRLIEKANEAVSDTHLPSWQYQETLLSKLIPTYEAKTYLSLTNLALMALLGFLESEGTSETEKATLNSFISSLSVDGRLQSLQSDKDSRKARRDLEALLRDTLYTILHDDPIDDESLKNLIRFFSEYRCIQSLRCLYGLRLSGLREVPNQVLPWLILVQVSFFHTLNYSGFIDSFTGDILCRVFPKQAGVYTNASPLYELSCTPEGQSLLSQLLTHNEGLAGQISGEALCRALPEQAGTHANASPLFWLSNTPLGKILLSQLLTHNEGLAGQISGEALCRALSEQAGVRANASPLYGLSCFLDGLYILYALLERNERLAREISGEALCRALPEQAGTHANVSPLYGLSCFLEGLYILYALLERNERLAHEISGEALCRALSEQAGLHANASPLYWLSCTPVGKILLRQLLIRNEGLAGQISGEALCRALREQAGMHANASPLYWLSTSPGSLSILYTLLKRNEGLAHEISIEALCRVVPVVQHGNNTALLYLLRDTVGWAILSILITAHPELAEICQEEVDTTASSLTL